MSAARTAALVAISLLFAGLSCQNASAPAPASGIMWGTGRFILGADVSWVPENESDDPNIGGRVWSEGGVQKDIFQIMHDHGFDYVRLRLFNDPNSPGGYGGGWCDLAHTKDLALRMKQAHLGFMLSFHYSDTWTNPGKQDKPWAWKDLHGDALVKAYNNYTRSALQELQAQGTMPSIVTLGNEVTHGMLWDDGRAEKDWPFFARLLKEGYKTVKEVSPDTLVAIHIERGQRLELTKWFCEQLAKYDVPYDVLAISCYAPEPEALKANLMYCIRKYNKPIILAEYADPKRQMNEAVYEVPGGMVLGSFVWEPTVERRRASPLFDSKGAALPALGLYDDLRRRFTAPRAWPGKPLPDSNDIARWEESRAKLPSLWLVGDATVRTDTDQWQGWGEVLFNHFDDSRINVYNKAVYGLTSRSYIAQGRWKEVLAAARPGDYVMVQFGYHDGGPIGGPRNGDRGVLPWVGDESKDYNDVRTKTIVTVHTFGWYLRQYIADARAKGLSVILVTSVPRDQWNADGSLDNVQRQYAQWTLQVGLQQNVPVLDLNTIVADRYSAMGKAKVSGTFFTANEHGLTTPAGAEFNAACLVKGIRDLKDCRLKDYLKKQP
jgi:arabinogalactan endo-1,4-beta-galactosidase